MIGFEDLEDNVIYISETDVYKKVNNSILQRVSIPNELWVELTISLVEALKDLMFETWKQRFGSEPSSF